MLENNCSVIIPVYNGQATLKKCLDSVLDQTYDNYEIIVVDNNSHDNSKNIIEEFKTKDQRIKYVFEKRQGVGLARNAGLDKAQGDIILFLDSDCTVPQNWIAEMIKPIIHENEKVVLGSEEDLIKNYWTSNIQKANQKFMQRNIDGQYINCLDGKNFAIQADLIKQLKFDPEIVYLDDFELFLRLRQISKIRFLPAVKVGHYHKSSFKQTLKLNFIRATWTVKIYKKHKEYLKTSQRIMTESISVKNFLTFPFWLILQLFKNRPQDFFWLLISELAWRTGIVWGLIKNYGKL